MYFQFSRPGRGVQLFGAPAAGSIPARRADGPRAGARHPRLTILVLVGLALLMPSNGAVATTPPSRTAAPAATAPSGDAAHTSPASSAIQPSHPSSSAASSATVPATNPTAGTTTAGSAASAGTAPSATTSGAAAAGTGLSITVPQGAYIAWWVHGPQGAPASAPIHLAHTAVLPDPDEKDADAIWVVDQSRNLLARMPAVPGKDTDLNIPARSFDAAYRVVVQVVGKNKLPVDTARVDIKDSAGRQSSRILTPGDAGTVSFFNVAVGQATIQAFSGADHGVVAALVEPAKAASPGLSVELLATAGVAPGTPTPTTTAGGGAVIGGAGIKPGLHATTELAPGAPEKPGGMGGVIVSLAFLALAGGSAFWAYRHPDHLKSSLQGLMQKVGLDPIPVPEAAPIGTAAPQSPVQAETGICPFCGTRKGPGNTGSCACSLVPAGVATPTAPVGPGPRLITLDGPARSRIFSLQQETTVGRDPENTIPLAGDTAVSRRHARFTPVDGGVEVVDEGSSNGTFVNGNRVTRHRLLPADEVLIGHSRFRFEVE